MMKFNGKIMSLFVLVFSLFTSLISFTAHSGAYVEHWGSNYHGHGGYGPGYYDRGGFYFGGGWGGPNVIINVPVQPYYAPPLCETVQVCDNYTDQCWLEQRCV